MKSEDIPRARWTEFLKEFGAEHVAWVADVEGLDRGLEEDDLEAVPEPGSVTFTGCRMEDDAVVLRVLDRGRQREVRVEHPRRIELQRGERTRGVELRIDAAGGHTVLVYLRAPARAGA